MLGLGHGKQVLILWRLQAFHKSVDDFAGWLGIGASLKSWKELYSKIKNGEGNATYHALTLVVWLAFFANKESLGNTSEELKRRMEYKRSPYYKD